MVARNFIKSTALTLLSCMAVGVSANAQVPFKPNVVVFYADDVGIGDISAYRGLGGANTLSSTPNIDALANDGMIFTDAHSAASLCAPSRYSLLTGNLPPRGRLFRGQFSAGGEFQILPGQKTTGNLFQDAGYNTGFIGKVHLGGGYSDSTGAPYVATNFATNSQRRPGLLFVDWMRGFRTSVNDIGFNYSFISHDGIQSSPYIYFQNNRPIDRLRFEGGRWRWGLATRNRAVVFDQDFIDNRLLGGEIESPDRGNNSTVGWPYWDSSKTGQVYTQAALGFIRRHARADSGAPFYMHFASQAVHSPHTPDERFFGRRVAGVERTPHLDMVREMDLQVKVIIDELKAQNLFDDTVFIFTSDNGGLRFSAGAGHETSGIYNGTKGSALEGGHRIPFIVRWTRRNGNFVTPRGSVCEEAVSQMDLFATFADLLSTPQNREQGLDSTSILPYFLGDFNTLLRRTLITLASELFSGPNAGQPSYTFRFARSGVKIIASVDEPSSEESIAQGAAVNLVAPDGIRAFYNLSSDVEESNDRLSELDAERRARFLTALTRRIVPRGLNTSGRSTLQQDADGDGLFDYWERIASGDLSTFGPSVFTSNNDTDGDGLSDFEEYVRRSNPSVAD